MRAYSYWDAMDSGLEPERYVFMKEAVTVRAYLDFKIWGKKQNLQCYFTDANNGHEFILSAFSHNTKRYTPKDKGLDFKDMIFFIHKALVRLARSAFPGTRYLISLHTAVRLVRNGHFDQTGLQSWE
mgnify:FL=1